VRIIRNIVLILILLFAFGCISCSSSQYPSGFSADVAESMLKSSQKSEIDYSKYVKIVYSPIQVLESEYMTYGSLVFDQVKFTIRIENISGKSLSFDCQIFHDAEFIDKFLETNPRVCNNAGVFTLEANKGYTIEAVTGIRNRDSLDANEKVQFDRTKDAFYYEFQIDGKWAYVKYTSS
jgi:hypothetical protein